MYSGGIGTYLRHILFHLKDTEHNIQLLLPEHIRASIYSLREQVELPLKIPPCDIFWSPHFTVPVFPIKAKKRIVTIHDLYHLDHLNQFSLPKRTYVKQMLTRAVRSADQLITVSHFSKDRLIHFFPAAKEKVAVVHPGSDHLLPLVEEEVAGVPHEFFLFVGNVKPHKNLSLILQAMEKKPAMHLVVVGKTEGFIHGVDRQGLKKQLQEVKGRVHFLGQVRDRQLVWLYKRAKALIFPSLYEGFGLPPVEAMRFGCPVIASHAASIPEVCKGAALYFDPRNAEDLCQKFDELETVKDKLVEEGYARAKDFQWKDAALSHLTLFDSALSCVPLVDGDAFP